MLTLATVPKGLPKAPLIPVWRRSAPIPKKCDCCARSVHSIGYCKPLTGTRQHLVDPDHMVRMNAYADVELILGRVLHHVLETRESKHQLQSAH